MSAILWMYEKLERIEKGIIVLQEENKQLKAENRRLQRVLVSNTEAAVKRIKELEQYRTTLEQAWNSTDYCCSDKPCAKAAVKNK